MKSTSHEICRIMKDKIRFFHFLHDSDAECIADFFYCRMVEAGEVLWNEGDDDNYVVFVTSGKLEEKKSTEFKDKQVVVGVYTEGAILGEFGILVDRSRAFSAVALEDSQLLILNRGDFERLTQEFPELGVKLLKGMLFAVSTRLRKSFERLASIF